MAENSRSLKAEVAGLHLTLIGFILLWFHQHELRVQGPAIVEVIGWIIVLAGGFVTLIAYFTD